MEDVCPEILRKLLRYEPETGKLFWRKRELKHFNATEGRAAANVCATWNAKHAGREALTGLSNGYRNGRVLDRPVRAHRVIWAMQTGAWPDADVDHINGVKDDNRWSNLRQASRSQNACNRPVEKRSAAGIKGVRWHKRDRRWIARIRANGKEFHLGSFLSAEAAKEAYGAASRRLHGEYAWQGTA
jgi:hypothetical protein